MIERRNVLKIIYEGNEKEIEIKSSLKEIKQEFIQQFNITKDFPIYFYYQINNDYSIILNDNSFSDFIESNITKLFAEKEIKEEKENIELNNRKIKSGLDLFIREFQNKINKVKVKNIIIISKECEVEYKLVNGNEKNIIKEIKDEIEKLRKENNILKEKNKKQSIINSTEPKEIEVIKNEKEKLLIENKKLKEIINTKNREEKELKKTIEDLTLEKNNLENETKNLQFIIEDNSNKENKNEEILKQRLSKMRRDYLSLQEKFNSKSKTEILKISDKFNINIIQKNDCYSNNSSNVETTTCYKSRSSNKLNKSKMINEKRKKYINKINKIYKNKMRKKTIEKKDNIIEKDYSDESDNDNYYINSSIISNKEDEIEKTKKEEEESMEKYKLYFFEVMKNKK